MTVAPTPTTSGYELRSRFIGSNFAKALTKGEFNDLSNAWNTILDHVRFEESVLQLIFAIEEFEAFLLSTGLEQYLRPKYEHEVMQTNRLRANLRMLGFLNSVTSLRDQFPKFSNLKPSLDARSEFMKRWEYQKANSVSVRFLERLRNYAQHKTQPASSVTLGGEWVAGHTLLESHVSVFVEVGAVCKNRDISAQEKAEYVKAFGEEADVSLVFRESVGRIGQVVIDMRGLLKQPIETAIGCYEQAVAIADSVGQPVLDVVDVHGKDPLTLFPIFDDFAKRARSLKATSVMTNNERHYISNRARGHKG